MKAYCTSGLCMLSVHVLTCTVIHTVYCLNHYSFMAIRGSIIISFILQLEHYQRLQGGSFPDRHKFIIMELVDFLIVVQVADHVQCNVKCHVHVTQCCLIVQLLLATEVCHWTLHASIIYQHDVFINHNILQQAIRFLL